MRFNRRRRLSVLSILGWVATVPSVLAAQAPSNVLVANGEWQRSPKATAVQCGLEAHIEGASDLQLAISGIPGQDRAIVSVLGNAPRIGPSNRSMDAQLIVFPSGERFTSSMTRVFNPMTSETSLVLSELPDRFLESFATGNAVNVELDGRSNFQIRYSGARQAVTEVAECQTRLLREWGLDAKQIASLKQKPRPIEPSRVFSGADYPIEALQEGEQGDVVIGFTVDVDGRAKDCSTIVSSGSSALDRQSCRLLMQRAKFLPALDESGKQIPVRVPQVVRWAFM